MYVIFEMVPTFVTDYPDSVPSGVTREKANLSIF